MQSREKIAARLRRYHIEIEDDFTNILNRSNVDNNFHPREIALLVSFNQAVKRLNQCYAHPQPNAAHIDSAWRHAKQLHDDITKHRVAWFMPQGVQNIERRASGDGEFPVNNIQAPKTGLTDFKNYPYTGLDDLRPASKPKYVTIDELKQFNRQNRQQMLRDAIYEG